MRVQAIVFYAIFAVSLVSLGCGGAGQNVNTAVNGNANNTAEAKATPDQNTNAAPTLTPVFKAYCDAMVKKDEAAIRKSYSADTIKDFESQMKDEKIKTLVKFLEDDAVSGKLCEVRNEVITGDKAVAEIRADAYPNGIKIEFVKEGGEWKLTNKSPSLDSVKANAANSASHASSDTLPANTAANKDAKKK